jgi:hypothetical protein
MRKLLLLFLILFSCLAQSQNIPGGAFRDLLLTANQSNRIALNSFQQPIIVDSDGDFQISELEAKSVFYLSVGDSNLNNIDGIEYFTNMIKLYCSNNQLSTLDLLNLSNLAVLVCENNNMTFLNLSGCIGLSELNCSNNKLTNLDLDESKLLTQLNCSNNSLSGIDLNELVDLRILNISNNPIGTLNLNSLINLGVLEARNTKIVFLDLSPNAKLCGFNLNDNSELTDLIFNNNNNLNEFDLRNCRSLENLTISNSGVNWIYLDELNSLSSLICTQNNGLSYISLNKSGKLTSRFDITDNQSLFNINVKYALFDNLDFSINNALNYICVNDDKLKEINAQIARYGYKFCYANTYCTLTPAINFNTLNTKISFDNNKNGCNELDPKTRFLKLKIDDGTNPSYAFTDYQESLEFYTKSGNFTISPEIENATFFNVDPVAANVNFIDDNNNTSNNNFCITPNGVHPDVEIFITPPYDIVPGSNTQYRVYIKNIGNSTLSGNVNLKFDDAVLDYLGSANVNSGSITWEYTKLEPFQSFVYIVDFKLNASTDTPPVNIGDIISIDATVNAFEGDENLNNNFFNYKEAIKNEGFLNYIKVRCLEGELVSSQKIGDYLHYSIEIDPDIYVNPENFTGRATIKFTLDSKMFDIKTLLFLSPIDIKENTVHAYLNGNILSISFNSLYDNLVFKIRTLSSLKAGNTVAIEPEITQELISFTRSTYQPFNVFLDDKATTTFDSTLSSSSLDIDSSIGLSPNPTRGFINIKAKSNINSVQLLDMQGRVLETKLLNDKYLNFDISNYSKGIYFLRIER